MIGKLSSSPFSSCSKTHSSYPKIGINAHLSPCNVRFQRKNDNKRSRNDNFVEIHQFDDLKRPFDNLNGGFRSKIGRKQASIKVLAFIS